MLVDINQLSNASLGCGSYTQDSTGKAFIGFCICYNDRPEKPQVLFRPIDAVVLALQILAKSLKAAIFYR